MKYISNLEGRCVCWWWMICFIWKCTLLKFKNNIKNVTLKTLSRLKEYYYCLLKMSFKFIFFIYFSPVLPFSKVFNILINKAVF